VTSTETLELQNQKVLQLRQAAVRENPRYFADMTIGQMRQQPPYVGFVDATVGDASFVMFLCNNDDGVAMRLLWKREFEAASTYLWQQLALDADLVLDVGGHTGIYTLIAGMTNTAAVIHTFEPHEMNFGRLLVNVRANGLPATNVHNVAASEQDGSANFNVKLSYYLTSGGSVVGESDGFSKVVPTRRIDSVVKNATAKRIIVKIDTEGHEIAVLEGMTTLLDQRPDIIVETEINHNMKDTQDRLLQRGYKFYAINDDKFRMSRRESLVPDGKDEKGKVNVLLSAREPDEVAALFDAAKRVYAEQCQSRAVS
jgi:FkbM family methyltransferase